MFGPLWWKSIQINVCSSHFFFSWSLLKIKCIRMCLIFTGNKWELASISRKGRKPCKRWLISSVSRGQNPLVLKNNLLLHKFISKLTETNNFKSYPEIEIFYFQCQLSCCWAEGFKVNCPLMGPGRIGGVSSVGVFLRDPSQYLSEFRRKLLKTPNG